MILVFGNMVLRAAFCVLLIGFPVTPRIARYFKLARVDGRDVNWFWKSERSTKSSISPTSEGSAVIS